MEQVWIPAPLFYFSSLKPGFPLETRQAETFSMMASG
jgi:hypothetical protein